MPIDFETNPPPRPPDLLIDRVTPGVRAEHADADRLTFDQSGQQSVRDIEASLAAIGRELSSFSRVLDFGCGSGRVTRWLRPLAPDLEVYGCDIDALAIEWDSANLGFGQFSVNDGEPPLPYPDGHFDLVLNHSVFTHLDERYQDLWLPELRRVLQPDGIALLSVHGERAFTITEGHARGGGSDPTAWRETLERDGILFIADDDYIGSSFPDFYHTTFHAPWYVFQHWSTWFDIRAYLPHSDLGFQDQIVLQRVETPAGDAALHARPAGSVPAPAPAAPGPGAPVAPAPASSQLKSVAARGLARVKRIGAPAAVPPAPAEAPADSQDRISPLVHAIVSKQGERITRLEQEVAALRRDTTSPPN